MICGKSKALPRVFMYVWCKCVCVRGSGVGGWRGAHVPKSIFSSGFLFTLNQVPQWSFCLYILLLRDIEPIPLISTNIHSWPWGGCSYRDGSWCGNASSKGCEPFLFLRAFHDPTHFLPVIQPSCSVCPSHQLSGSSCLPFFLPSPVQQPAKPHAVHILTSQLDNQPTSRAANHSIS